MLTKKKKSLLSQDIKGITLLILGAVVVGSVDNVLRRLILGQRIKLNELFLFLSILGGIKVFGLSGLILGPILLTVLIGFIEIYKVEYREIEPDDGF